jgi:hypothetical protein
MRIQSFWIVKPSIMVIDSWRSKGSRNINIGETSNLASVQVVGVPATIQHKHTPHKRNITPCQIAMYK